MAVIDQRLHKGQVVFCLQILCLNERVDSIVWIFMHHLLHFDKWVEGNEVIKKWVFYWFNSVEVYASFWFYRGTLYNVS